jgi:hypothetical protein
MEVAITKVWSELIVSQVETMLKQVYGSARVEVEKEEEEKKE